MSDWRAGWRLAGRRNAGVSRSLVAAWNREIDAEIEQVNALLCQPFTALDVKPEKPTGLTVSTMAKAMDETLGEFYREHVFAPDATTFPTDIKAARRAGKSALVDAWHREMDKYKKRWGLAQNFYHGEAAMQMGDSNYTGCQSSSTMADPADCYSAETIKVGNCGRADGECVRRSDYEAISAELVKVRKELEVAGAVCRLSALPHSTDMVPAEQHYREVKEMRAEIERLQAERDKYEAMWKQVAAISQVNGDMVSGERYERDVAALRHEIERLESIVKSREGKPSDSEMKGFGPHLQHVFDLRAEIASLRSQLALAEERRRPARHRPGEVRVGWDPEGD